MPNQIEQPSSPEQKLEARGYSISTESQRGQKIDVVIKDNAGQEGAGEGYTRELAIDNAIRALDYITGKDHQAE